MPRPDPESAHLAFLETSRMLREASGGGSVTELEWAVLQALARDAAELFDDLPLEPAPAARRAIPRRWWQLRDRVGQVEQKHLAGRVVVDSAQTTPQQAAVEITTFLLGRDGVLRVDMDFIRGERSRMALKPGWLPPDDPRWDQMFYWNVSNNAEPLVAGELEMDETEQLLAAFDRLSAMTRDRTAARLKRLRDRGHL